MKLTFAFVHLLTSDQVNMTKQRPKHRPKKGRRTLNTPKDFSARDKVNATLKKELVNELLTTGKTPLVLIEL